MIYFFISEVRTLSLEYFATTVSQSQQDKNIKRQMSNIKMEFSVMNFPNNKEFLKWLIHLDDRVPHMVAVK
jgi:hypothetical protein